MSEQRIANRVWVPIAATITAVAVIMMIVLVRGMELRSPAQAPQLTSVANNIPPAKALLPDVASSAASNSPAAGKKTGERRRRDSLPQPALDTVVLVPSGQKETVDALLVGLTRGTVKSTNLIADEIEQVPQDLRVLPLMLPPIEMKPLADPSEESSAEKGKITR